VVCSTFSSLILIVPESLRNDHIEFTMQRSHAIPSRVAFSDSGIIFAVILIFLEGFNLYFHLS